MARQFKEGLDYFELDCVLDDNMRLLQAEFGLKGFAIVVKLWQKIYSGRGYYCEWNKDIALLFMSDNGLNGEANFIEEVIQCCFKRDILSREMFEKYGILTSRGIQKRYLNAVSRRENIVLKNEYLLVEVRNKIINVSNNSNNVDNNSNNVDSNSQSRGEKRKEKKRREKEREEAPHTLLYGSFNNVNITEEQYNEILNTYENGQSKIDKISEYLANANKDFKNHYALICKIARDDNWIRRRKIEVVDEPKVEMTEEEKAEAEQLRKQMIAKLRGGVFKEV